MKFSELMRRMQERGVVVEEMRAGGDPEVLRVCEDSRQVKAGDLFVARGGTQVKGAAFAADAVARGAVAVVAGGGEECPSLAVPFAKVTDANLACALLAHEVAAHPTASMKVIAVTGTKGKTTVAYLLRSVLRAAGHKVGMIGTVEIDAGGATAVPAEMTTPGSVALVELFSRMKANGVTHCVMEVSSHALHQHRVAGVAFAVGIFTNLTGDHLDYHRTMEEYAAAKGMLFEGLNADAVAVVNVDDAWAERIMKACGQGKVVTFGVEGVNLRGAEWMGTIEEMKSDRMRLAVRGPGVDRRLETPLVGRHNAYNLLSVIAAAHAVGVDGETTFAALGQAIGAPGRLQRVGLNGTPMPFQVFVDYAHTHDALENVLKALRATMGHGKLICVFGCGGDRDRTKRPKMGRIAEELADRVIVTSDNPRTEDPSAILGEICAGFGPGWKESGSVLVEADRRTAIRRAIDLAGHGDVVLIAGKGHENYQVLGTTKHHFDDVEEAAAALSERLGVPA